MASTVKTLLHDKLPRHHLKNKGIPKKEKNQEKLIMSTEDETLIAADDFDFVSHYGDTVEEQGDELLPDNTA